MIYIQRISIDAFDKFYVAMTNKKIHGVHIVIYDDLFSDKGKNIYIFDIMYIWIMKDYFNAQDLQNRAKQYIIFQS